MRSVSSRRILAPVGVSLALLASAAAGGNFVAGDGNFVTFESGQVRPLALSPDGSRLFAVDTPDDRLEIFNVTEGGRAAVAKVRHQAELLHAPAAKPAPVGAAS